MATDTHENAHAGNERTALVFGATGKQGGAVARALRARGWTVRALVRDVESDRARSLSSNGIQLRAGDFSNVEAVRSAMAGAHGVFSMQPNAGSAGSGITNADEAHFGKSVADIALESGVEHLIYTSANIIAGGETGLANLDTKIEIESHIRNLDLVSTIIRPVAFMDLFTLPGMGLEQGVFSFFIHPTQTLQAIAVEDIGKIVAMIFEDKDRYAGQTIPIAGDHLTGLELGQALTKASGRTITYQRFPDSLLAENEFLGRNAKLFEDSRGTGNIDIASLKSEFGDLFSVADWLSGPGKASLEAALSANGQSVALK